MRQPLDEHDIEGLDSDEWIRLQRLRDQQEWEAMQRAIADAEEQEVCEKGVKCYKCGGCFIPEKKALDAWGNSGRDFDPTDWDCGCGDRTIIVPEDDELGEWPF